MLSPEKYMDLDRSVLMITSLILNYIITKRVVKVNALFSFIENKVGDGINEDFLSALTILYAFGKIEYFDNNDSLSLVNYSEAK